MKHNLPSVVRLYPLYSVSEEEANISLKKGGVSLSEQDSFHISAEDFARKYHAGELQGDQIIDVREQEEWDFIHLDGTRLIPLQTLPAHLEEIDRSRPVYLLCAHGVRSIHACNFLYHHGIQQVINIDGGLAEVMIYIDQYKE